MWYTECLWIYLPFWIIISSATPIRKAFFSTLTRKAHIRWFDITNAILLWVQLQPCWIKLRTIINSRHTMYTYTIYYSTETSFLISQRLVLSLIHKPVREKARFHKLLQVVKFSMATQKIETSIQRVCIYVLNLLCTF